MTKISLKPWKHSGVTKNNLAVSCLPLKKKGILKRSKNFAQRIMSATGIVSVLLFCCFFLAILEFQLYVEMWIFHRIQNPSEYKVTQDYTWIRQIAHVLDVIKYYKFVLCLSEILNSANIAMTQCQNQFCFAHISLLLVTMECYFCVCMMK